MSKDVVRSYSEILNKEGRVNKINDTVIVLIPTVPEPEDMTQFSPISLCRMINKDFMAKLDMSKAYDQVKWDFLKTMLDHMGFSPWWIMRVMNSVRSVKYVVKCDSCLSDDFCSERGLR